MADTPKAISPSDRVFRQIEAQADFYPPLTYSKLLTFYDDFVPTADSASGQFIPLTQVTRHWNPQSARQHTLLFAVGILPPAANVTGRLLDRTASVPTDGLIGQTGEGAVAQAAAASGPAGKDQVSGSGGRSAALHRQARQTVRDAFKELYGREPTLEELQYAQAVAWLESSYGQGWKGDMVGSNNWGAVQCAKNKQTAAGCISYQDSYEDGTKYTVSFRSYETPKDGAKDLLKHVFTYRGTSNAINGGDIMQGSYEMRRGKYYGGFCPKATKQYGKAVTASLGAPDKNDATKACAEEAINAHANTVKALVNDIAAANGDPWALGLGSFNQADSWWRDKEAAKEAAKAGGAVAGDAGNGAWKDSGSKNAADAAAQAASTAGSPLLTSDLNKALIAAQQAQIAATQKALSDMANCPPLAMLVNPASFSVKGEKIVNDGNWGRNGPIIEYWGDQQDKISGSGKIGGFFAMDTANATSPGLTRWARNYSAAWQNFQSLFQLYRSNGALFLPDDTTGQNYQSLHMLGSIYIFYDNVLYIGSFDTFSITENDSAPHTIEYSFEFTVRAAYLLDRTDDAFDYGIQQYLRIDVPATNMAGQTVPTQAPGMTSSQAATALFGTPQ